MYFAAVASVAGVAAIVAPAFGGGSPGEGPTVKQAEARRVGLTTRDDGTRISLFDAPTTEGGQCLLVQLGNVDSRGLGNGGSICQRGRVVPQRAPIATFITWGLDGNAYSVTLSGRVRPELVKRLQLVRGELAAEELELTEGYFVADLPNVPAAGVVSNGAAYVLVGYDARGKRVESVDLRALVESARPAG